MKISQTVNRKISELLGKYISLEAEILQNQLILREYENDIKRLMISNGINSYKAPEIKREIEIKTIISESFNSKKFQKENKKIYEAFRFPSKRFDAKELKKAEPKLYEKYIEKSTSEAFEIRKIESHTFEELPEIE